MAKLRTKLYTLYRRMTRLERAVLVLLCVFAVKFVCSTAAHFVPGLQAVDMLGSGRNPVDIWLLLLSLCNQYDPDKDYSAELKAAKKE